MLSTFEIKSTLNEIYAITEVNQSYTNNTDNLIELKCSFPIREGVHLSRFTVFIGDKIIISKITDKDKAEQKYSNSFSSGYIPVYSSQVNHTQEVKIGYLKPKDTVILATEYIQMISSSDMSYEYSLVKAYPSIITIDGKFIQGIPLKGIIILKTHSKITRLITKNEKDCYSIESKFNNDYREANITFEYKGSNDNSKDYPYLSILFRTETINIPTLYAQYDKEKHETSYALHYIYSSNKMKEIPVLSSPDCDNTINYYRKYQDHIINDNPALFIFLIDQSASMVDKPNEYLKRSLIYFIHSLPVGSYYQIIGFGSSFKKYNDAPLSYTPNNITNTFYQVSKLKADLGCSEILPPLKSIYSAHYEEHYLAKHIILLTDGDLDDKRECLRLIQENENEFRVHAIGIGKNYKKETIMQIGKVGNGSYSFVDNLGDINSSVIDTVNLCLRNYLYKVNFDIRDSYIRYPLEKNNVYQDDVVIFSYIKRGDINKGKIGIKMNAYIPKEGKKEERKIIIDKPVILEEGNILGKIIIGNFIKRITDEIIITGLSKEYQVLSKYTALYGEIKAEHSIENIDDINIVELGNTINQNIQPSTIPKIPAPIPPVIKSAPTPPKPIPAVPSSALPVCPGFIPSLQVPKVPSYIPPLNVNAQINKDLQKNNKYITDYDLLILEQDCIEGYWKNSECIQSLFTQSDIKEIYEKISKHLVNDSNKDNILITFIVLFYLIEKSKEKEKESRLIINKAKLYLEKNNYSYNKLRQLI